jgi:hypothetical protein
MIEDTLMGTVRDRQSMRRRKVDARFPLTGGAFITSCT